MKPAADVRLTVDWPGEYGEISPCYRLVRNKLHTISKCFCGIEEGKEGSSFIKFSFAPVVLNAHFCFFFVMVAII